MKPRIYLSVAIFGCLFLGITSRTFAAPIDLEGYVVAGIKPTSTGSEISVTSEDEEKDLFKKQETVKEQAQKESTEKAALTKNLNYLLVQAYKGKIDKIFGNLRVNIDKYPAEVQIRIFKQVSESVAVKLQMIEEKGESLGPNRKEVLGSVLEYIQSLVSADIARVKKEK